MKTERIIIDYEKIRKNYDNALISTARGFENLYDFLDYWVPDEDELKSIINLLQIAKDEKIKNIELNISVNIKSLIDIKKLEEQILEIGIIAKQELKQNSSSNYFINFES